MHKHTEVFSKDAINTKLFWDKIDRMDEANSLNINAPTFVSLGYNCEISQILSLIFGSIDSYVWSWSFCHSYEGLISSIYNPENILLSNKELDFGGKGIRFTDYSMSFHTRGFVNTLHGDDPNILELESRIKHLAYKFSQLKKMSENVIFISKYNWEYDVELKDYVCGLRRALDDCGYCNSLLLIIISKELSVEPFDPVKLSGFSTGLYGGVFDNVQLHYVDYYSPSNYTKEDCCWIQWFDILSKYATISKYVYYSNVVNVYDEFINKNQHYEKINRVNSQIRLIINDDLKDDRVNLLRYIILCKHINNTVSDNFIMGVYEAIHTKESV